MTSEHLLDAMGLLDDDLILDAETRPKTTLFTNARRLANRWAPLAACLVLVFTLGYGATHLWTVGSDSATSTAAPETEGQVTESAGSVRPGSQNQSSVGDVEPSHPEGNVHLFLAEGNGVYTITGQVGALPEGCRSLGVLNAMPDPGSQPRHPAVDGEAWVGLELWAEGEDPLPGTLYIGRAGGRYAVAELVQP